MLVKTNIGSNESGTYKDVEIKFPKPIGEIPEEIDQTIIVVGTVVLDTANFPENGDRYTVNVSDITRFGFTARVARLDGEGWSMDLSLNYTANRCTIFAG